MKSSLGPDYPPMGGATVVDRRAGPEAAPPAAPGTPPAAILASACRLFAAQGFSATTTRSIAEAADVNLAMIHYYFGNKEQLYRKVLAQELVELTRIMRKVAEADAAPQDILAAWPGFILELHMKRPDLMRLVLRDMTDSAPRLPAVVRELGEQGPLGLRQFLVGVIEAVQVEGFAAGIPPTHLVAIFLGIGNGLVAFAPMIAAVLDLDMRDPETAAAVGRSAGTVVRRAVAPVKEA